MHNFPGSDEAFHIELCKRYYDRIYAYCYRLTGGQDQFRDFVEDSTQSTFLEAYKHISLLRKHPSIEGWLYTTARNIVNKTYRSMYTKRKHIVDLDDEIACTLSDPVDEMESQYGNIMDYEKIAANVLSLLSPNEYDLYINYYRNRLSISDLSIKYNISITAVTTRIYRLKAKIKIIAHEYLQKNFKI